MTTDKSGWVLGRVLADQAASRGDAPFLQFRNGEPLTFAQAGATANRVANGLTELGVGKGHRVEALLKTPTQKVQKGKLRDAGPISSWPGPLVTRLEYRT